MKKNITFLLALSLLLTGCGFQSAVQNPDTNAPSVATPRATLNLVSNKTTIKVGDTFTVQLFLSNAQKEVTTITPYMLFDAKKVDVKNVNMAGSTLSSVYRNVVNKKEGVIELSLSPSIGQPGVTGDNNLVATITFQAQQAGSTIIGLEQNKTKVYLADNTNVSPQTLPTITITITK